MSVLAMPLTLPAAHRLCLLVRIKLHHGDDDACSMRKATLSTSYEIGDAYIPSQQTRSGRTSSSDVHTRVRKQLCYRKLLIIPVNDSQQG
jgi:hypothetical protein